MHAALPDKHGISDHVPGGERLHDELHLEGHGNLCLVQIPQLDTVNKTSKFEKRERRLFLVMSVSNGKLKGMAKDGLILKECISLFSVMLFNAKIGKNNYSFSLKHNSC